MSVYDDMANINGIGRADVEARIRWFAKQCKILNDNLTSVQTRCTELLEENRALRAPKDSGHVCGVLGACDGHK
jgi:hypothetical protein